MRNRGKQNQLLYFLFSWKENATGNRSLKSTACKVPQIRPIFFIATLKTQRTDKINITNHFTAHWETNKAISFSWYLIQYIRKCGRAHNVNPVFFFFLIWGDPTFFCDIPFVFCWFFFFFFPLDDLNRRFY